MNWNKDFVSNGIGLDQDIVHVGGNSYWGWGGGGSHANIYMCLDLPVQQGSTILSYVQLPVISQQKFICVHLQFQLLTICIFPANYLRFFGSYTAMLV